jgi:hypothetical protein
MILIPVLTEILIVAVIYAALVVVAAWRVRPDPTPITIFRHNARRS